MYERMQNGMRMAIQETIVQLFQSSLDKITEMMEMSNKRTDLTAANKQTQKKCFTNVLSNIYRVPFIGFEPPIGSDGGVTQYKPGICILLQVIGHLSV